MMTKTEDVLESTPGSGQSPGSVVPGPTPTPFDSNFTSRQPAHQTTPWLAPRSNQDQLEALQLHIIYSRPVTDACGRAIRVLRTPAAA